MCWSCAAVPQLSHLSSVRDFSDLSDLSLVTRSSKKARSRFILDSYSVTSVSVFSFSSSASLQPVFSRSAKARGESNLSSGVSQVNMAVSLEAWFQSIPPVTKYLFLATIGITLCANYSIGPLTFANLYWDVQLLWEKFHVIISLLFDCVVLEAGQSILYSWTWNVFLNRSFLSVYVRSIYILYYMPAIQNLLKKKSIRD